MDAERSYVAPSTCTVVEERERQGGRGKSGSLTGYVAAAAYVLIAEPGAGKTTACETEGGNPGAVYETVRDFRNSDDKPEWRGKTLFLDGLDESRAGASDRRTPLDDILQKLERLDRP